MRGIVHRDLKPQNILLTAAAQPRVTDFGLARRIDLPEGITASGEVLGTPSYMSPEQAAGKTSLVGPPTDIYAMGAILYYALAGRPPFQGTNVLEIIRRVSDGRFEPLRSVNPSVPAPLEAICSRCMAKDPNLRFKSAGELAAALSRLLRTPGTGSVAAAPHRSSAAKLFISFSRKDQTIAETSCDMLEAAGIPCWIAPRDIAAGRSWEKSSRRAIKESRVVLLILSSFSNKSERVLQEIELAARAGATIVTFCIEDVQPAMLAPFLRGPHRIDALAEPLDPHFSRLCTVVSALFPKKKGGAGRGSVRPAGETRDDNGLKLPLAWCPPGKFRMGSPPTELGRIGNEGPVDVTLTKGFWLGQHGVTQSEWQRVMQTTPWSGQNYVKEGEDYPATYVSWEDAIRFCEKLTEMERDAGRLPALEIQVADRGTMGIRLPGRGEIPILIRGR